MLIGMVDLWFSATVLKNYATGWSIKKKLNGNSHSTSFLLMDLPVIGVILKEKKCILVRLEFGNLPHYVYRSVTALKIGRGGNLR